MHYRHIFGFVISGSLCVAVTNEMPANLISADFGPSTTTNDFSGVEYDAANADALFADANVWNTLRVADFQKTPTINPSFSGLLDNQGNATTAMFSITGEMKGFDFIDWFPFSAHLLPQYLEASCTDIST